MQQYPVGGPREPVYALMRNLGFSMSGWSDKHWKSADGIEVHIYGAGSMARFKRGEGQERECKLDDLSGQIAELRGV